MEQTEKTKSSKKQDKEDKPVTQQVAPKLRMKGSEVFRHDLFKLMPVELKRNVSFKKGHVEIQRITHQHFFHTCDSNGRPQQFSTPTGGHFHEITWGMDPETGELKGKCGPAKQYVYKKRAGSQRRVLEKVQWMDEASEDPGMVVDDHVHECVYQFSEELSSATVRNRRKAAEERARADIEQQNQAKRLGLEAGLE